MFYKDWVSHVKKDCIIRTNKIYTIIFQITDSGLYIERIQINPEYRGRGYLKRIFTNLCKEFKTSLYLQCTQDLRPMYEHIGCYTMETSDWKFDIEMYFDPFDYNL